MLKKTLLPAAIIAISQLSEGYTMQSLQQGLAPSQRPDSLKQDIQFDFGRISSSNPNLDNWNFNGSSTYAFLQINPAELVESIIKTAPPAQKDFYILDIGAGRFNWGIATAKYLNKQKDIPDDVTIHIVSVTGENYGSLEVQNTGRCKLYNIGAFKIEDLKDSFEKLELDFNGKFDLIVSQYTFIHLHDPVGTFVQAYNLLRSGTGLMLMEGFPVYFEPQEDDSLHFSMIELLSLTNAPFLIGAPATNRGIISFLLRRPDTTLLDLPLSYGGTIRTIVANTNTKSVAYFLKNKNPDRMLKSSQDLKFQRENTFYGDKDLYEWVYTNYPYWQTITTSWWPLFEGDEHSRIEHSEDPLFYAASMEDLEKIKNLIEHGGRNVNEKDPLGKSLLARAKNEETLKWLLDQPDLEVNIQDKDGHTILWFYMRENPSIVKMLIDRGADINIPDNDGNTPLHRAISFGDRANREVIKLLLENGADPTITNKKGQTPFDLKGARVPKIQTIIEEYQNNG